MVKARGTAGTTPAGSPKRRSSRGGQPRKHVPIRTCVACRQTGNKRELVRLVRTPDAGVLVDITGKRAGRGAYLCRNRVCWEQALRSQRLSQALKATLTTEEMGALQAFAATLPEIPTVGTEPPAGAVPSTEHK